MSRAQRMMSLGSPVLTIPQIGWFNHYLDTKRIVQPLPTPTRKWTWDRCCSAKTENGDSLVFSVKILYIYFPGFQILYIFEPCSNERHIENANFYTCLYRSQSSNVFDIFIQLYFVFFVKKFYIDSLGKRQHNHCL